MLNPYESSATSNTDISSDSRGSATIRSLLTFSGVVLALPPLPLFFWVADGEPFVGPTNYYDLSLVTFSGCVGVAWGIWASITILGIRRRWLPSVWFWTLLGAVVFGGISLFVVYCYGVDRGWFPHW